MKRFFQSVLLLTLAVSLSLHSFGAAAVELSREELGPYYSPMQRMCVERTNAALINMIEPQKFDQLCQCAAQQLAASVKKMSAKDLAQAQQADVKRRTDGEALQVIASCFAPVLSDVLATKVLDRCQARFAQAALSGQTIKGSEAFCTCMSASLKRHYATEEVLSTVFRMSSEPNPDTSGIKDYVVKTAGDVATQAQQECISLIKP